MTVPPGVSVELPITTFEAELNVKVEPPAVKIVAGELTSPAAEIVVCPTLCVAPLTITAVPVLASTNVVGDCVPEPGTMTVPPGVSVELPMTKLELEFPTIVVPPAVMTGAMVGGDVVAGAGFCAGVVAGGFPVRYELDRKM